MTHDLGTLYRDYLAALNARQLGEIHRFAHEQLTFNGAAVARDDYIASIATHIQSVPDLHWQIEDMVVEHDRVAVRLLDRGTPIKEWLGLPPTGNSIETQEYAFYAYRDGRFFNMWYLLDYQTAQRQLHRE